nr:piggyBac transposable element-derived protein 4-like [Misgurnus anguillicaudatus]XP_055061723.1 piggyBac transposable element-derived protein 4-like [Misgurnus anguillicaudatus]XP_055061724.1 piggyBac transposable element-derived protein 4-like [Misgurnus anguillicaudatus]XP_055061725.1 piggyBac transposable element-derived protein 4-like [Misgurnus anguillicaudatus]
MDPENTENGVEEAAGFNDEDLEFCDEESVASSVDTTIEEMFLDGLDPVLDQPKMDSPEKDCDSEVDLQKRKRPRLSYTSSSCEEGDMEEENENQPLPDVSSEASKERWHNANETDVEPPCILFTPIETPGPKNVPSNCSSPQQFFKLFFTKSVLQGIVGHTNVYGTKCKDKTGKRWLYISHQDFKSFIAMVIYMGLFKCSSLKDYWSESRYLSLPFPAQVMSYRNFLIISNALHLSNTSEDEKNEMMKETSSYEKLGKIKSMYLEIREACKKYFHPFQNITIDERMVMSQARNELGECSKSKPASRGYKLFALSDCNTSYTWDFFIYEGKSRAPQSQGLSYESVMSLVDENYLGDGYKLFLDKYFTSPGLFSDLLLKKIWACGPVWANRKGFPEAAVNKLQRNDLRGTVRWIRDNELLFVEWQDVQKVQMCSTFHKAYGGDTVKRKVKDKDGNRTLADIPIPAAVLDYKRTMSAVDPSNRITAHYRTLNKPKKWYQCFFYHFLDIAINNAFILQELIAKERNTKALTRREFLETLIEELTEIGSQKRFLIALSARSQKSTSAPPSTPCPPAPSDTPAFPHRPRYIAQDSTIGRRKCKHCRYQTPIVCETCHVPLCFQPKRDCFGEWHEQQLL